jgi:hypothetical protein
VSTAEGSPNLLAALCEAGIDFVVVGGMAGVMQGASVTTHDLDIVPSREPSNLDRLLALLERLDARYRGQPRDRVLRPTKAELSGHGHLNLVTALGPLDVLCELDPGVGYEDLAADAVELSDGEHVAHVLRLRRLVEMKKRSTRAKDRLMLPELLAALEEQERQDHE